MIENKPKPKNCSNWEKCLNINGPQLTEDDFYRQTKNGNLFSQCKKCVSTKNKMRRDADVSLGSADKVAYFKNIAVAKRTNALYSAIKRGAISQQDFATILREVNIYELQGKS